VLPVAGRIGPPLIRWSVCSTGSSTVWPAEWTVAVTCSAACRWRAGRLGCWWGRCAAWRRVMAW